MSFIGDLRKNDKKGLFDTTDDFDSYSTSFLPLDFANGFICNFKDPVSGIYVPQPVVGVMSGRHTTVIGETGSCKSTLAESIGGSIVRQFEDALLMDIDAERTALKPWLAKICGLPEDDERLVINNTHVSIEETLELIDRICETKEQGKGLYQYTLKRTISGKEVKMYVPTVIIIDSIYVFNSLELKTDELEGQMEGGRAAKQIAQFYNKTLANMIKYNINIIAVNHIKANIDLNMFSKTPKQMMMLKQGETIPRGKMPLYMSQNVFRCGVSSAKDNMYTMEDHGFRGMKVNVQIAKTKTAFVGSSVNLVFNSQFGLDPVYTLYEFAYDCGLLQGRNPYIYVQGLEEFKFSRKNFRKLFIDNPEFRNEFYKVIQPHLNALLGTKASTKDEQEESQMYFDVNMDRGNNEELINQAVIDTNNAAEVIDITETVNSIKKAKKTA